MSTTTRWILTFDSSCGTCSAVSSAVAGASRGKLEVMPLTDAAVRRWRAEAMGPDPVWAPTLLRVTGGSARAWTGPRMTPPLVRRLGVRATGRVLVALGELRHAARTGRNVPAADSAVQQARAGVSRKRFLLLAGGVSTAVGITAAGRTPAFARSADTEARAWVAAHRDTLPRTYADIAPLPSAVRQAVLVELSPTERSRVWTEHLTTFRAAHPSLTAQQSRVLQDALALAGSEATFAAGEPTKGSALQRRISAVEAAAKETFGVADSAALLVTLGPAGATQAHSGRSRTAAGIQDTCNCSTTSVWCTVWEGPHCNCCFCGVTSGCGFLGLYQCNGTCTK
ncbi:bacteriocin fulvocin C-related protein [Streptomyces yunnanensis]|uniref:Bacteriocin fulvocin C-related protein n=1 Tax=Streptomyces yunnanensis TaxID=156453 RepID=A0ABY8AK11_9ACTN|nr:bacteriocin fulvocin C-related protein [Streptomyces yunnanensis]WEB45368.1 bacteriocin fulvocin C-related protein [Streptomyces yunnanensis]